MPKPLTVWITINCGKFWKRWEYQTTWPASWETNTHVRKQQLELDVETTNWFQIGKGVGQGCILPSCLFNFYAEYIMRNAGLEETKAWSSIQICKQSTSRNSLRPPWSMGFSRQEYSSGLSVPPPASCPRDWTHLSHWQAGSSPLNHLGRPEKCTLTH